MINLREKPFYLDDKQIKWVNDIFDSMTLDEKIGQLFVVLKANPGVDEKQLKDIVDNVHKMVNISGKRNLFYL